MGHWEKLGLPSDFDGVVRLFPLPNLVMFPHVVQALHIFEPRYCELLSDAIETDNLITLSILEPGWESNYQYQPRISKVVCIGRIISHTPLGDGRHNILLAGLHRARIVEELDVDTSFRQARVEVLPEVPFDDDVQEEAARLELLRLFRIVLPAELSASSAFTELLSQNLSLSLLTDIVAYAVNLSTTVKYSLLAETRVERRYEILMDELTQLDKIGRAHV